MLRSVCCDACGHELAWGQAGVYTWVIHANAVAETSPPCDAEDADDFDLDSVEEMDAMLRERRSDGDTVEMLPVGVERRYHVCASCYGRLLRDPLGLDVRRVQPFSRN